MHLLLYVLEANLLVALFNVFMSNFDQNADPLIKIIVLLQQIEFPVHMTWPDSLFTETVSLNKPCSGHIQLLLAQQRMLHIPIIALIK